MSVEFIRYPNPLYTPITETLPDNTLVAYDEVSDLWSSRDMKIYRKGSNETWIKKFISIWDKYVRRPNNHSRYPHVSGNGKMLDAHAVAVRAWLGPVPAGFQIDHINGDNRNFNIDNLRILPIWMNHRDGGFLRKLRNKKIDPRMYAVPFLLRFFERMTEYKRTHSTFQYGRLTQRDMLKMLVAPEFEVRDPADCEC